MDFKGYHPSTVSPKMPSAYLLFVFDVDYAPLERTFMNRTTNERRLHGRNWHRSTMEHTTVERGAHGCSGFSLIFQNLEAYQA